MLKGAILVAGLLLIMFGAERLVLAATNQQQVTVSCESFYDSPPSALWLRITGCEIDYIGAGYREWRGRIVQMYFPARPVGRTADPARIVATTTDPAVLTLAEGTIGGGRTPDQEQFLVMMLKIVTALRAARVIDGYAKASLLERITSREAIGGLSTPIAPDAIVIDLNRRPRMLGPGAATIAGVMLIGLFAVLQFRRRTVTPRPMPAAPDVTTALSPPTEAAAAIMSATRLRLLLLNLAPDVGADAIEHAPPLGRRDEVIATIGRVLPGIRFDASGEGSSGGPDFLLTVNIGPTDPVYAVVLDARGAPALSIVKRVLEQTGWRAFAAKTGVFINAERLEEPEAVPHTAA